MTPYEFIERHKLEASNETMAMIRSHDWVPAERDDTDWWWVDAKWVCSRCGAPILLSKISTRLAPRAKDMTCTRRVMEKAIE